MFGILTAVIMITANISLREIVRVILKLTYNYITKQAPFLHFLALVPP